MKSSFQDVVSALSDERNYQNRKWGTLEEHPHDVGGRLTIMRVCLSKAELAWTTKRGDEGALDEIRQICSTGIACLQQHGVIPRNPVDYADISSHFDVSKAEK